MKSDRRSGRHPVTGGAVYALAGLTSFVIACAGWATAAQSAIANAPIHEFSITPSTTQAGGHPNSLTHFVLGGRVSEPKPDSCNCNDARETVVHAPAGVIADPHAAPYCSEADFGEVVFFGATNCPVDSQVGVVAIDGILGAAHLPEIPVFNLEPHPHEAGLLGFYVPAINSPIFVEVNPRTQSDFGLDLTTINITHLLPLEEFELTLWGVPAASSNNGDRFPYEWSAQVGESANGYLPPTASNAPEIPFLSNPTRCGVPLFSTLDVLAYDEGTSEAVAPYPSTTGCELLTFNPSLSAQPTTSDTDSPSGLEVSLSVPQEQSPTVPSPSELQSSSVALPAGLSINSSAADGKTSCSNTQARIGTQEEAQCPEFSRIGTLSLESSALPGPIPGYIYIGEPLPGDRYRIILSANGFNTHVKIVGAVEPNPQSGQLTVVFESLPQSPFTDFNMHFFGSDRGLLATPTTCGTYPVDSTFNPWDSALAAQTASQVFSLDSGPNGISCPGSRRPFRPGFRAASSNSAPGSHSPFSVEFSRSDGDQNLSSLSVVAPPGLSATLRGLSYCTDAEIVAAAQPSYSGLEEETRPSCPAASQIGTSETGAGAGGHPVYLSGKVYLAGPYKGAPLSLVVITPAVSGPYDLGNVVVRAAVQVNPESAQITAASDPLPQIIDGIPLRLRSIRVNLDRPGFALNPTNCSPLSVEGFATGDQGSREDESQHFQVANCGGLKFTPKLTLNLSGATKRDGNPALTSTLVAQAGEANIASVSVALPASELIDNAHIKDPCTRVQFASNSCPVSSAIGFAKVETPLLDNPLEGAVYLRSAPENKSGLPDVVAALRGQIDINLDGKIESIRGRLRASFRGVPDAPVNRFTLELDGGRKGLLVNSSNLCHTSLSTLTRLTGQNGAIEVKKQKVTPPCRQPAGRRHRLDRENAPGGR